jgi:DNA repair protein RadC
MVSMVRETNERAKAQGFDALSDAELVAMVLKHKTYEKDEVMFARDLLVKAGGLRGLMDGENELPESKRLQLEAIREIGRRYLKEKVVGANYVRSPQAVQDYLMNDMRDRSREVFKVMYLDKGLKVLGVEDLFEGTIDEAAVHPREIVRAVIKHDASSVVLCHNHPSGKVEPSREDYEITQKIKAALQTIGVRVLDHIIIGENQYFSFSERNSL